MRGKQMGCTLEKQDIGVGWEQSAQNTYNKGSRINYSILSISSRARSANWLFVTIISHHLFQQARGCSMGEKLLEPLARLRAASQGT